MKIEIKLLTADHAELLVALLSTASVQDKKWFHPFYFDINLIERFLHEARQDQYYGCFMDSNRLVAFHMLRGCDQGYQSPMYGAYVSPLYRRSGIGRMSMLHAVSVSKLSECPSLLLKVYDENIAAVQLYRQSGFVEIKRSGNAMTMEKKFSFV